MHMCTQTRRECAPKLQVAAPRARRLALLRKMHQSSRQTLSCHLTLARQRTTAFATHVLTACQEVRARPRDGSCRACRDTR
jgi:hypothetical protein